MGLADVAAVMDLTPAAPLPGPCLAALFTDAHTAYRFTDAPVSDEQVADAYRLARMAPTSMNCQPLRIALIRSPRARAALLPMLAEGNRAKAASAAVIAVLAADTDFPHHLPRLAPHLPDAAAGFTDPAARESFALANARLQAGYFILALRAVGLDVGPMGGFNAAAVTESVLAATSWRAFLVVNIGHAAEDGTRPRAPRLEPAEVMWTI